MSAGTRSIMAKPVQISTLKWAAGMIAVILIQVSVLKYIAIEVQHNISVQPDLILLTVFFLGLHASRNATIITGFFSGLLYDLIGGGIPGLTAFSKTVFGFLTGYVPPQHKIRKISQFALILFVLTLLHDFIINAVYVINTDIDYWRLVALHSVPSSVYTVFIGIIVFYWQQQ